MSGTRQVFASFALAICASLQLVGCSPVSPEDSLTLEVLDALTEQPIVNARVHVWQLTLIPEYTLSHVDSTDRRGLVRFELENQDVWDFSVSAVDYENTSGEIPEGAVRYTVRINPVESSPSQIWLSVPAALLSIPNMGA